MKEKLKSYSFWIAIASSIMLLLQSLGTKIDLPFMDSVLNAFLGIFVALGLLDKPLKKSVGDVDSKGEQALKEDIKKVLESADIDIDIEKVDNVMGSNSQDQNKYIN